MLIANASQVAIAAQLITSLHTPCRASLADLKIFIALEDACAGHRHVTRAHREVAQGRLTQQTLFVFRETHAADALRLHQLFPLSTYSERRADQTQKRSSTQRDSYPIRNRPRAEMRIEPALQKLKSKAAQGLKSVPFGAGLDVQHLLINTVALLSWFSL